MTRYAIYAIPGADATAAGIAVRLGYAAAAWFEREDVRGLAASAVRYGFHATLKAPFRLADQATEAGLCAAVGRFAAQSASVVIPALRQTAIGRFRALVPGGDHGPLERLAADVVRSFEPFRAALTAEEFAWRRPEALTPRRRKLLEEYGYPYVLDEFYFHMTLTDRLGPEEGPMIDAAIAHHFAFALGADVPLTALAVCVEPGPGEAFRTLATFPLGTSAATDQEIEIP